MQHIGNSQARYFVSDKQPFVGKDLFARWIGDLYVVFSIGEHNPIFVWSTHESRWFENAQPASVTIMTHIKQARPRTDATPMPTTLVGAANLRRMVDLVSSFHNRAGGTDSSSGVSST